LGNKLQRGFKFAHLYRKGFPPLSRKLLHRFDFALLSAGLNKDWEETVPHHSLIACALLYCLVCTEASAQKRHKIVVDSVPSGASIYLEDKAAGVQGLTPHTFSMKPGTYTFILEALDYHPLTRTVKVKGKANYTFTLEPTPLTEGFPSCTLLTPS